MSTPLVRPVFHDGSTRGEMRAYLYANWRDGVPCPCCDQRVQLYLRRINRGQAETLIALARETLARRINDRHFPWINVERDLVDEGKAPKRARDFSLLRFCGLIEPFDDGSSTKKATGDWRITAFGMWVVEHPRTELLPAYVEVFNGRPRGQSKKKRTLLDALRRPFSFEQEVLRRVA